MAPVLPALVVGATIVGAVAPIATEVELKPKPLKADVPWVTVKLYAVATVARVAVLLSVVVMVKL